MPKKSAILTWGLLIFIFIAFSVVYLLILRWDNQGKQIELVDKGNFNVSETQEQNIDQDANQNQEINTPTSRISCSLVEADNVRDDIYLFHGTLVEKGDQFIKIEEEGGENSVVKIDLNESITYSKAINKEESESIQKEDLEVGDNLGFFLLKDQDEYIINTIKVFTEF
jgi:hypothetical protein